MISKKEEKIDDIELYEFFKDFSCGHFNIQYDHDTHCWNTKFEHRTEEVSREDLVKLESYLKEFSFKYHNKPEKEHKVLKYISEEN